MKSGTKQIIRIMNVLSWIAFIGVLYITDVLIWSFFAGLFIDSAAQGKFYIEPNLSALKTFSTTYYCIMLGVTIIIWVMKALLFYFVVKIFTKINFVHPFSAEINKLIKGISAVALVIGIASGIVNGYSEWLAKQSVSISNLSHYTSGASEFIFFAGIVFIISLVMQRGIEIQSENELTV